MKIRRSLIGLSAATSLGLGLVVSRRWSRSEALADNDRGEAHEHWRSLEVSRVHAGWAAPLSLPCRHHLPCQQPQAGGKAGGPHALGLHSTRRPSCWLLHAISSNL